jgi:hypothetical protein
VTPVFRKKGYEKCFSDQIVAEIGVLSAITKCHKILEKNTQEHLQFMCTV